MAKRKQNKHEQEAFMYLRGGNLLGAAPVELVVKRAADAIDPRVTDGIRGLGVAIPAMELAIKLLVNAHAAACAALAVQQERDEARQRAAKRGRR